jgi:hypothetical protein
MQTLEIAHFEPDSGRGQRPYGLLSERQLEQSHQLALEDQARELFDWLVSITNGGVVAVGSKQMRLDQLIEKGTEVRSIVVAVYGRGDDEVVCQNYSYLTLENGESYFETHPSVEKNGQLIWEPAIGSDDVLLGSREDVTFFYQVIYDATALLDSGQ